MNLKPANVSFPPIEETITLPEAPLPTKAVIVVALTTLNESAETPPKLTPDTPVKFVPVMVTVVLSVPDVGVKEVIVGGQGTTPVAMKLPQESGLVPTEIVEATVFVAAFITVILALP